MTHETRQALHSALARLGADSPPSRAEVPSAAPVVPGMPPRPGGVPEIDWAEVVTLRRRASEEITQELDHRRTELGHPLGPQDRVQLGRAIVRQVVRRRVEELAAVGRELWSVDTEHAYQRAVHDAIYGYGRLQPLFELEGAENIEIHGWDSVVVQYADGHREQHAPVADSDEELVEAIRFLGEQAEPSRPFDDVHPMMTVAVGERFRLHAIGFGLSFRPSVVIRQHIFTDVTLEQLSATGMFPSYVADLLHRSVLARKSIVISGDQGAGKTTLLRALISAIPDSERFGTLETDYELLTHLQPRRRNMIALQARVGLGETQEGRRLGEWTVADLIPEALRQNLSRIIVGEVRGVEAGAMFEAMQAGTGTLSTTHSHSASSTIDRLASRVAHGGLMSMEQAYRQIAHNIDLLVHVGLRDDTWRGGVRTRYISEIRAVTGSLEEGRPLTHLLYARSRPGSAEVFHPEPALLDDLSQFTPIHRTAP